MSQPKRKGERSGPPGNRERYRPRGRRERPPGDEPVARETAAAYLEPTEERGRVSFEEIRRLPFVCSAEEISDLLERRTQARVEHRLVRRYTWIGSFIGIIAGGSGYLAVEQAIKEAEVQLAVTQELNRRHLSTLMAMDSTLTRLEDAEQTLRRLEQEMLSEKEQARFTASGLRAVLRKMLDLPSDPISEEEMDQIRELERSDREPGP